MLHIRKILFPTDFSDLSSDALAYALFLARKYKAELHMLHIVVMHTEDPHNPDHHFPDDAAIRDKLSRLIKAQLSTDTAKNDLTIKHVQLRNISAASAVVDYAEEQDIDLIVMSTHGRRGLRNLLLGSTAAEVVRTAPCSILTIRRHENVVPGYIRNVLVPTDFSEPAAEALAVARDVASRYEADLQVLHVFEDVIHPAFYNMGKMSIKDLQPDIEERTVETMKKLLTSAPGPEVTAEYYVLEGHAGRDIPRFAEEHDSDLVVISTHGLSGLEQLLIGSVTEKVVRRTECPVLVVKTFKKSLLEQSK